MTGYLHDLHASLDRRRRPEDVLDTILAGDPHALQDPQLTARIRAIRHRGWGMWSSMTDDFTRPVDGAKVLASVGRAFHTDMPDIGDVDVADPDALDTAAAVVGATVGWSPDQETGDPDRHHRLTRAERAAAGVTLSRRQYARRARATRRLHLKAGRLRTTQTLRRLELTGRAGFAAHITVAQFVADPAAAHFAAYWVARKNVRRGFSLAGKANAMDEVAAALFARCTANPDTDWWLLALVRPTPDIVTHLTAVRRGELLGRWSATMRETATLLRTLWDPTTDRERMTVRRGQDSSTWNTTAQAYNAARAAWLACLAATNTTALLDVACPGKAMRYMAADLAYWHHSAGSHVEPNTAVWALLPLPWEVLDGDATCTRADVIRGCRDAGLDPRKSGWTAPLPPGGVVPFALTPELVHGVTIGDPAWAALLRRAGAFSGRDRDLHPDDAAAVHAGLRGGVVLSDLPVMTKPAASPVTLEEAPYER